MTTGTGSHGVTALALLSGGALLAAAPTPCASLATLRGLATAAGEQQGPLAGVLAVVALAAWLLVAYLAVVVLLTWATGLPRVGAVCAGALRRVAPATLRSAVAVTIGVTVVVGSTSAASATSSSTGPVGSVSSMGSTGSTGSVGSVSEDPDAIGDLDWPVPAPRTASPAPAPTRSSPPSSSTSPAQPQATPASPTSGVRRTPAAPAGQVVVQAGDTLWELAAGALPADASEAAVAAAWPQWWAANRAVIGENPDQIWPGQVLQVPV